MKGNTFLFEFRNGWKGLIIFMVIVILLMAGYVQIYPSFSGAFDENLEGAENLEIKVDKEAGVIRLDWEEMKNAFNYTLKVNNIPQMIHPIDQVRGIEETSYEYLIIDEEMNDELYFAVVGVRENSTEEFIGMQTNVERENPYEELMGRDPTYIGDFISMLYDMWFILLIGLYLAYISVNSITKDFEEGRMDILFSTPLSRKQYLLEKFSAYAFYTFVLLSLTALAMVGSVYSLGELGQLPAWNLFLSMILSWPLFLVIIAFSLLAGVYFKSSKVAVSMSFFFLFVQYAIHLVADMGETLEVVKPYTLITYWDYSSVLDDGVVSSINFALLLAVSIILLSVAFIVFEKRDIPV